MKMLRDERHAEIFLDGSVRFLLSHSLDASERALIKDLKAC